MVTPAGPVLPAARTILSVTLRLLMLTPAFASEEIGSDDTAIIMPRESRAIMSSAEEMPMGWGSETAADAHATSAAMARARMGAIVLAAFEFAVVGSVLCVCQCNPEFASIEIHREMFAKLSRCRILRESRLTTHTTRTRTCNVCMQCFPDGEGDK